MSRLIEFHKGLAIVHGATDRVWLSAKDFPPLNPSVSKFGPSSTTAPPPANPGSMNSSPAVPSIVHATAQPAPSPTVCWSSLFHFEKAAKLQYHKRQVADGKPSVFIPNSVNNLGFSNWEDYLVGPFLGVSPPLSQIQVVICQI